MKKVSIILLNWNGLHHLRKCLPGLIKIDHKNYEIILVDNASADGSLDYVRRNYPKIKIIINKENLGFSGGNNVGYKYATGEYILFLNNDTIVTKEFLSKMVMKLEEDDKTAGVQSKILTMDDRDRLDTAGAFLTNTGFLYHYGYLQKDNQQYDQVNYLYTAKGACMLVRKKIIDRIGLFDDGFFAYFEETDFCNRAWLAGYNIRYAPEAVIYHKVGGTFNSVNNAFVQFHSFKNRINSYIKNLGIAELLKILPLHLLLCEVAAMAFILKRRPQLFLAINNAMFYNVIYLRATLNKRRYIQNKLRKRTDKEFFNKIKVSAGFKYYYYLFTNKLENYKDEKVIIND